MKIIGKRRIRHISDIPKGLLLKQGALFNDEIHKMPTGNTTFFPKGIYRYETHEEANKHWEQCVITGMVINNVRK